MDMPVDAERPPRLLSYRHEARTLFQVGDVLLFCGGGFSSWLIRKATGSEYSHVGIVYIWDGPAPDGSISEHDVTASEERVYCLESRGKQGVRLILMSELLRTYHGGVKYYENTHMSAKQRAKAIGFGFVQLGKAYDTLNLFRFAWLLILKAIGRLKMEKYRADQNWFSSSRSHRHGGADVRAVP